MENESLLENTIMFEMSGKNQGIHEYDKMIWNLRIGFLTVFFAVWSLLIKSIIDNANIICLNKTLLLMSIIAFFVALGALIIDINYTRRKYRVIKAINVLYKCILNEDNDSTINKSAYLKVLLISGTTLDSKNDDLSDLKDTGFYQELYVAFTVYVMPLLISLLGFCLLSL
jgi:hypothetical protein